MRWSTFLAGLVLVTAPAFPQATENPMNLKKLTPVLFVDSIEKNLPFWVERLGFKKTLSVPPEGDTLAFVILELDDVEVMLQTWKSLRDDIPALAEEPSRSFLYIEVGDLAPIEKRLEGADIVMPKRRTFYGADEIGVRDPAGNVVTFALHGQS